jgi:DNA-binding transcriptional LysR family regulator
LGAHKLLHYTNQANGAVCRMTSQTGEKRQILTTANFMVYNGQFLLNASINSLGIAYLPSPLSTSALAEGRVADVMPELRKETLGIYVVYSSGNFTQLALRAFTDYLAQTFAQKGPDH